MVGYDGVGMRGADRRVDEDNEEGGMRGRHRVQAGLGETCRAGCTERARGVPTELERREVVMGPVERLLSLVRRPTPCVLRDPYLPMKNAITDYPPCVPSCQRESSIQRPLLSGLAAFTIAHHMDRRSRYPPYAALDLRRL